MKNTRRDFLKMTTVGLAGCMIPSLATATTVKKGVSARSSVYDSVQYDVVVVGAGASGIPAAIAAARQGAKVALVEEDLLPGGAPVDQFVTYLCGGPRVGIYLEMIQGLNSRYSNDGVALPDFGDGGDGRSHWWHPSAFSQILYEMIVKEKSLTLICGAPVVDVIVTSGRVLGVQVFRNGGMQEISGKMTIDATGTGLVAEMAGCEVMYGTDAQSDYNEPFGVEAASDRVQPCTWMMITNRVKAGAVLPYNDLERVSISEDKYGFLKEHPGWEGRDAGMYLHWGWGKHFVDTRDPQALAEAQGYCLEKIQKDLNTLRKAGFSAVMAPKIGVRECRRIKGEYILTATDLKSGLQPEDKIADCSYYMDDWSMSLTKEQKAVKPYGIPFRCLIPVGVEGLLLAGRIISGTHLAASSYRVQPICAAIGEAAGLAAAKAAALNTSVRNLNFRDIGCELKGIRVNSL